MVCNYYFLSPLKKTNFIFFNQSINKITNTLSPTQGGGNLVQTIRKSYSLSDLSEPDIHRSQDELDEIIRPQRILRSQRPVSTRSASGGRNSDMYFTEVDVVKQRDFR